MEAAAEGLIRATLHDLSNVLSGIQGIIELAPEERPLSPRDRQRLWAALAEGQTTLQRARNLAMETLPLRDAEPLETWKDRLDSQLEPLRVIFRASTDIRAELAPGTVLPGTLFRGWIHATARLLLPYAGDRGLTLALREAEDGWELLLSPAGTLPDALDPSGPEPKDIASRWARRLGETLGIRLEHQGESIRAFLPRS